MGELKRTLGVADAVVIGLGSMVGAGIFAALGPAAEAAGPGLLVALAIAGVVAFCNATSSADLAALYPEAGGTYVYGRRRLGEVWGFAAGWSFVFGKTASCAAMALTFGAYASEELMRPLAIAAVVGLTALNYRGIERTAAATRVIVAIVLTCLAAMVAATALGGELETARLEPLFSSGPYGVLQAGGLLFFAFAGYARIATLGEEVRDPSRTIPRAMPLALGIALGVYALVALLALLAAGPELLAASEEPLVAAVEVGSFSALAPAVEIGAVVASLGVLLSMIAGVSRTTLAMARRRELPGTLAAVHPTYGVPHRADIAIATVVCVVVAVADVREAIGFSSFLVLVYYAIANASALTLPAGERRLPRSVPALGLAGCLLLALALPAISLLAGAAVLAAGLTGRIVIAR